MTTWRLIVGYDGTDLSGWQRQVGVRTVQEELERAAAEMAGHAVTIRGAGRTDAGVHALAQVASFATTRSIPARGWHFGLNARLPDDIAVREAREVPDGYDPRRVSGGKRYRYLLYRGRTRDPLLRERAWHVYDRLDLDAMARAAQVLHGAHDFGAFRAANCQAKTTVRHLWRVALVHGYGGRDDVLAVEVEGTAFLKNMVRILTGTLVDVGRGRLDVATVAARLADGDRTRAGVTAPPHGLYLDEVFVRAECRLPDDSLALRPPAAEALLATLGSDSAS